MFQGVTMDIKLFKCEHCGNIAIKVVDAGVPMMCCGEKMVELGAGSVAAAVEKHVPVVSVDGAQVHVQVGEVEHPMTEEHLIQFVILVTEKGYQVAKLTAEDAPKADFVVAEGDAPLKVYEYCNLHGLWVAEL